MRLEVLAKSIVTFVAISFQEFFKTKQTLATNHEQRYSIVFNCSSDQCGVRYVNTTYSHLFKKDVKNHKLIEKTLKQNLIYKLVSHINFYQVGI